jgi:hypothetical protein
VRWRESSDMNGMQYGGGRAFIFPSTDNEEMLSMEDGRKKTHTFPVGITLYGRWWDTTTGVNLRAVMTILLNTECQSRACG